MSQNNGILEGMFKISERGSTVKQEVIGGVTTFLAMSYIIFVNPSILGDAGMNVGALITVTCLASALATLLSGIWANAPFALAPGMGLNAFFTYTLVLGTWNRIYFWILFSFTFNRWNKRKNCKCYTSSIENSSGWRNRNVHYFNRT